MFTKALFLFVIINFVSDSYGQRDKKFFRLDYEYNESFESFYKIHTTRKKWPDAKEICALEGATLWHPDNENEAQAILSLWNTKQPIIQREKDRVRELHVGLSDILVEGVFKTVDGKPISEVYNRWGGGQPDNYKHRQHCGAIRLDGTLDDDYCDSKAPFICKKTLKSLEWNYQCRMPDLDYIYSDDTGKCYKVHATPVPWSAAYTMCQLELSSLAVISNRLEANYVAKLAEITPKPKVKGKYQRGIYHLGFHNRFKDGWRTVSGVPMNGDADAWFDKYIPEIDDRAKCGSMLYTGRLINVKCDTKSYYICEHLIDNVNSPVNVNLDDPFIGVGVE